MTMIIASFYIFINKNKKIAAQSLILFLIFISQEVKAEKLFEQDKLSLLFVLMFGLICLLKLGGNKK